VGIRIRILLLVMGVALPLVGVGLANLLWMRTASRQQIDVSLQNQAGLAAAAFEKWLDNQREPLLTVAASVGDEPGPLNFRDFRFFVTTRPSWIALRIFDASGKGATHPEDPASDLPEAPPNLLDAVGRGWGAVEMVFPEGAEERPILIVGQPIEGGGAVIAYVDATAIREVFEDIELPNDGVIVVFDPSHRVVYRSRPFGYGNPLGEDLSGTPLVDSLQDVSSAVVEGTSPLDEERRVYGLARVGETGCIVSVGVPSASLYEPARQQLNRYFLLSGLALILATGAALVIARGIVQPVRRLRGVANKLGAGDLATRADIVGQGELAELGRAFNRMAESLEERDARLSELDRLKSEFVGSVSHELRTPLTTIKTLTRVLQRGSASESEQREYLEAIAAECDRQIDLVLNLLDLSRIEAGAFSLAPKRVDVSDVIHACVKIERHAADLRGHELSAEIEPGLPGALADRVALRRVLCSLIENAFKYTPDGGRVTISARSAADEVAIDVSDTGVGIAPYDLPHIFDKFYRGGRARSDDGDGPESPGVGLGLYLAKTIVDHLGGRLEVTSVVGRGSTFTIFLRGWQEAEEPVEGDAHAEAVTGR
jgi:signal transduction histidine kinase